MQILDYDLPDKGLIDVQALTHDWIVWQPGKLMIVMGQSNKLERSVFVERAEQDQVPVYKRPSGGETVVLSEKTLVISVRLIAERLDNPQVYFKLINQAIITALESCGVQNLAYKGISDIAIGERKILGSSIYRKKNLVFYHAVLNLAEEIETITKYLPHPPKEPDYRQGRSHRDFVTSLKYDGYVLDLANLTQQLDRCFDATLHKSDAG